MPISSSAPAFPAIVQSNHILNPTAISFNPTATSYIPCRQSLPGPAHIPLNQQPNHNVSLLHGVYSFQPQTVSFSTSQSNYRQIFPPNLQTTNATSMMTLPQASHGYPTTGSRLSPLGPNSPPSVKDANRGYHYTQVPPPQDTYPNRRQFSSYSNGNFFNSLTNNPNDGWSISNAHSAQQGRLGNSDNPFSADQPGNLRPYGLGRE